MKKLIIKQLIRLIIPATSILIVLTAMTVAAEFLPKQYEYLPAAKKILKNFN